MNFFMWSRGRYFNHWPVEGYNYVRVTDYIARVSYLIPKHQYHEMLIKIDA